MLLPSAAGSLEREEESEEEEASAAWMEEVEKDGCRGGREVEN